MARKTEEMPAADAKEANRRRQREWRERQEGLRLLRAYVAPEDYEEAGKLLEALIKRRGKGVVYYGKVRGKNKVGAT